MEFRLNYDPLDKRGLQALEAEVDRHFATHALPGDDRYASVWNLCTVAEDLHRILLMQSASCWINPSERANRASFMLELDAYKYSLQHCLRRIYRLPVKSDNLPVVVSAGAYEASLDHIRDHGREYAEVSRIFARCYEGIAGLEYDSVVNRVRVVSKAIDSPYTTLEIVSDDDEDSFSPIVVLGTLFNGVKSVSETGQEYEWGEPILDVVKRARVKNGRVKYTYVTQLARAIYGDFDQGTHVVPESWNFPWGSADACKRFCVALQTILFYHLVSIHFAACRDKLVGGGLDQLTFLTSVKELLDRICRTSGLTYGSAEAILHALTYGNATENPDPALQPLLPLGGNRLLALPTFFLSSKWSRNLLSLHSRVDPRSFDRQSKIFEIRMVEGIRSAIGARFDPEFNRTIANEEIDLLLVDLQHKVVLLCELRWVLQPGDPREVNQKRKALQQKVRQVERKRNRVAAASLKERRKIHPSIDDSWSFHGIVVVEGYGGTVSEHPQHLPIVPKTVFLEVVQGVENLDLLHAMFTSPLWLPRDGIDFHREIRDTPLCGAVFERAVMTIGDATYMPTSLRGYLEEMKLLGASKLRAAPWPDSIMNGDLG